MFIACESDEGICVDGMHDVDDNTEFLVVDKSSVAFLLLESLKISCESSALALFPMMIQNVLCLKEVKQAWVLVVPVDLLKQ